MNSLVQYLLLDAARCGTENIEIAEANTNGRFESLYVFNNDNQHLKIVAPYLFQSESILSEWYYKNGWSNAWGLIVQTDLKFEEIRYHFRKFLKIKMETEKQLYFRFYDPRVLRIFLPTCDTKQLQEFFGPIKQFICEDKDASFALIFSFNGNKLITEKVATDTIFKTTKETERPAVPQSRQGNDDSEKKNDITQQEAKPKRRFFY